MELWKNIEEHDNYQVSSHGNIKNVKTGKILKGDINNIGYRRVIINNKKYFIHRLVAKYFCDGYQENLVVNHKDGNKLNNHKDNLEWVTRSQNDLHAYKLNLRKPSPCTFKHRVIQYDLTTQTIIIIYNDVDQCSKALNVTRTNIYNTCNGIQKSCRGFGLRYE